MRTRLYAVAAGAVAAGAIAGSLFGGSGPVGAQFEESPPPWTAARPDGELSFDRCLGFGTYSELTEPEGGQQGPIFGRFVPETEPATIVCERPASADTTLWQWRAQAAAGQPVAVQDVIFSRAAFADQPAFAFYAASTIPLEVVVIQRPDGSLTEVATFVSIHVDRP